MVNQIKEQVKDNFTGRINYGGSNVYFSGKMNDTNEAERVL
jgi:hypothetical protein